MRVTITVKALLAALVLSASTLSAAPVITSISPASGPVEGGTVVTIKGTGFHSCFFCTPPVPPTIYVGGILTRVDILDEQTIQFVTPAHLPGSVRITVDQDDGVASLADAFTYTGAIDTAFERVLLPILAGPTIGANGSLFITSLRVANPSSTQGIDVFGLERYCPLSGCIPIDLFGTPYHIQPGVSLDPGEFEYRGRPGAFLYLPKSGPEPAMNLRVYDDSRGAFNFGTEIPVVHEREFTTTPIELLGVPLDPRFRHRLRIYATARTSVMVSWSDIATQVMVEPGENEFYPAYAELGDLAAGEGTIDVRVTPSSITPPMPGLSAPGVWAFISVTNNDTQLITTITPQR